MATSLPSPASVFYPSPVSAATNLKTATLFTRLHILASPSDVQTAIANNPNLRATFMLGHHSDVLVFDKEKELHTAHVRMVLQMCKEKDLRCALQKCAFDMPDWTAAGFHIEEIGRVVYGCFEGASGGGDVGGY
jgi:hypothetical protein